MASAPAARAAKSATDGHSRTPGQSQVRLRAGDGKAGAGTLGVNIQPGTAPGRDAAGWAVEIPRALRQRRARARGTRVDGTRRRWGEHWGEPGWAGGRVVRRRARQHPSTSAAYGVGFQWNPGKGALPPLLFPRRCRGRGQGAPGLCPVKAPGTGAGERVRKKRER